jgi:hypothetical protein
MCSLTSLHLSLDSLCTQSTHMASSSSSTHSSMNPFSSASGLTLALPPTICCLTQLQRLSLTLSPHASPDFYHCPTQTTLPTSSSHAQQDHSSSRNGHLFPGPSHSPPTPADCAMLSVPNTTSKHQLLMAMHSLSRGSGSIAGSSTGSHCRPMCLHVPVTLPSALTPAPHSSQLPLVELGPELCSLPSLTHLELEGVIPHRRWAKINHRNQHLHLQCFLLNINSSGTKHSWTYYSLSAFHLGGVYGMEI